MGEENSWNELVFDYLEEIYFFGAMKKLYKINSKKGTMEPSSQLVPFINSMKKKEETINYFFNVLLKIIPNRIRLSLIQERFPEVNEKLEFKGASDKIAYKNIVHPDTIIESKSKLFFLELKTNKTTKIKLDQIYKYVLLHAMYRGAGISKKPYLLIIADNDIVHKWDNRSKELEREFNNSLTIEQLNNYIRNKDVNDSLRVVSTNQVKKEIKNKLTLINEIISELKIDWITWNEINIILKKELKKSNSETKEMLESIIPDFIKFVETHSG